MFQHTEIDRLLMPRILRGTEAWQSMQDLEQGANAAIEAMREMRREQSPRYGRLRSLAVRIDDWLRTDKPEHLDEPDFPPERKQAIVQALHRFNQGVLAYRRFFAVLRPMIRAVADEQQRPVRILELASGSGEFSFAMAELAASAGLSVEVTGSDYFIEHVEAGNRKASERGADVRFVQVNAFDMSSIAPGSYDIVFIAQSIHHFTPGQVAMMIAQATRVATVGFIGIDGRSSPELWGLVPMPSLFLGTDYAHDAFVTLRKFYTESELELIARLAVPKGFVSVRPELPGYSVVMACG